jgi:hypothetical protein
MSFKVSSSGALVGGVDGLDNGTITVDAPTGTTFGDFNTCFDYVIDDTTTGQSWCPDQALISPGGNQVTIMLNDATTAATINAGDSVTVTIDDVTNPPSGGSFSGVSLYTSSDTIPFSYSGGGSFTSTKSITDLSFSPSTSAGAASEAQWHLGFTTSATGTLASGSGTIVIAAPGASFADSAACSLTDTTTASAGECSVAPDGLNYSEAVVTLPISVSVNAGDSVTLSVGGVTNPPAGTGLSGTSVSTSSDTSPVTVSSAGSFTPAGAIGDLTLTPSTTAAYATGAQWAIGFRASSTGTLVGGITANNDGTITVAGPPGTEFYAGSGCSIDDATSGYTEACTVASVTDAGSEAVVTLNGGSTDATVNAGDSVVLTINDVTNPASGTNFSGVSVSTSSDTTSVAFTGTGSFAGSTGATLSGTVLYNGSPVANAGLQVCPTTGVCFTALSDSSGDFTMAAPDGSYTITAFPPSFDLHVAPVSTSITVTGTTAVTGVSVDLQELTAMPVNETLSQNGNTFPAGSYPILYFGAPFTFTVTGQCANGYGVASDTLVNVYTGLPSTIYATMTETPPGSGTYVADFPAVAPLHGTGEIGTGILCPAWFAANPGVQPLGPAETVASTPLASTLPPKLSPPYTSKPPDPNVPQDPSGTVVDQDGNPVTDATVTILRSDDAAGPFTAPPSGSPYIEPSLNPEETTAAGQFAWEVLSGYYEVSATAPGCYAPGNSSQPSVTSSAFPVPPPQTGLVLTMDCPNDTQTAPTVASRSPPSGAAAGGQSVTVFGSGFVNVKSVTFGTVGATSFEVITPTTLSAVIPSGTGTVHVTVTTSGGTSPPTTADEFTYLGTPIISTLSPASGPAVGGSTVTVTGSVLIGVQTLIVGGQSVAFSTVSDTTLTYVSPGGTGTVQVVATSPCTDGAVPPLADSCGASAPSSFTYIGSPAKLAFTNGPPSRSQAGANFNVTVSVEDANGNVVDTDDSSSVTLKITSGTGTSGAALGCTTNPVTDSDGLAPFTCSVNDPGNNYTLTATAASLTSATSAEFNVNAASAPKLSLRFSGALAYTNSATVTSGGITVNPSSGTISSVTGTATIPGLDGGSATITAEIFRVKGIYIGLITVSDPKAALNTTSVVLSTSLTRTATGLAAGTATGLYHGRAYLLSFTV